MTGLKRTYHTNWGTPAKNAKKLRKLENVVYRRNLGEIKRVTAHNRTVTVPAFTTAVGLHQQILTGIATGANQGQRIGNEIRVRSIYVSGAISGNNLDVFLIQSRTGDVPSTGNFLPVINTQLTQGTGANHFRILAHNKTTNNRDDVYNFNMRVRFSIPMKVTYTGPTSTETSSNQIYIVFVNGDGTALTAQFASTLEYID